jgi:hypothetical protein
MLKSHAVAHMAVVTPTWSEALIGVNWQFQPRTTAQHQDMLSFKWWLAYFSLFLGFDGLLNSHHSATVGSFIFVPRTTISFYVNNL